MDKCSLKQKRSIKTRDKILETALLLFSNEGYYKVTTNEIAKVCNISIGTLYFHFKNKDQILLEILDSYHNSFLDDMKKQSGNIPDKITRKELEKILYMFIKSLIKSHRKSKDFNREIKALSYNNSQIQSISKKNKLLEYEITKNYISKISDCPEIEDLDAVSYIIYGITENIVNSISFEYSPVDDERLIKAGIMSIIKILYAEDKSRSN